MFSLSDTGLANLLEKGIHLRKVRLEGCKYVFSPLSPLPLVVFFPR
jgi:hypothetical protein